MDGERPTTSESRNRAIFSVAVTLSAVLVGTMGGAACVVVPPPSSKSQESPRQSPGPMSHEPGLETGFTHCCGDVDYVMQVDCSDRLMRCYSIESNRWRQTYGRNCKEALGQACYEQGCLSVCDGN